MEEITAGDIMLGNWFIGYDNKPFKWGIEHFALLTLEKNAPTVDELIREPIPLTEDILLKAGATPYTAKDTFILGNIIIDIKLGIVMLDCIDYTPLLCKCKYLHTFQNIVKLLTGNDLKIEV